MFFHSMACQKKLHIFPAEGDSLDKDNINSIQLQASGRVLRAKAINLEL